MLSPPYWFRYPYCISADICELPPLLMERNYLTEEEAHKYLQKCSMDNGTNMVETAQMILTLLFDET